MVVGTNVPKASDSRFFDNNILEIAKKRSPTLRCAKCGAPTAGTYYPYCPDCYKKSLDPNGGVPPIPVIIDPLKQME
jgi:lipopolysaccharide biosynthesis regulator YciM